MAFSGLRAAVRGVNQRIRKIPAFYRFTFVTVATCTGGIAYLYSQNQLKLPKLENPINTPLSPQPPLKYTEDITVHPKESSNQKPDFKKYFQENLPSTAPIYNQISNIFSTLYEKSYFYIDSTLKKLRSYRLYINDILPLFFQYPNFPFHALPPELPKGYQQPLTLCFDMDVILESYPDMTRAGFEYFIMNVTQFSEVVVLSQFPTDEVSEVFSILDKMSIIPFRLGHEYFWDFQMYYPYKRDLRHLNRDLSKVVVIDYDKELYPFQPENVLVLPQREWQKNPTDTDLFDIVPLLYILAKEAARKKDVRKIVKKFDDIDPAKLIRLAIKGHCN